MGERNSGKGVICELLALAFQRFVQTINSENLLCTRMVDGDAAKKQSWMSSLEFTRIAVSNEIQFQTEYHKVDGNMIKRLASGGDTVEVRTNYKDEVRKKLQCTMFLCCNEFPPVSPVDTYETLEVINFRTTFENKEEIDARGDSCPAHWAPRDDDIKRWIQVSVVNHTQCALEKIMQ